LEEVGVLCSSISRIWTAFEVEVEVAVEVKAALL
jgi:hypothetical protein